MIAGRIFAFWAFVVIAGAIVVQVQRALKQSTKIEIRRINALDAIEEAIGRATEMGRPIHFSAGMGDVAAGLPDMLAGLEVLAHVAKRAAEMNTRLIATVSQPSTYPVTAEVVRTAFLQAGRPDAFREDTVRFLSPDQWAYAAGIVGIINLEGVAANLLIGHFAAETMLVAEAGHMAGAMQVAGTTNMYQLPFFVAACDYTLLGEEMYAAGAYFSNNPVQLGTMSGEDFGKTVGLVLLVLGVLLATGNVKWLATLMQK